MVGPRGGGASPSAPPASVVSDGQGGAICSQAVAVSALSRGRLPTTLRATEIVSARRPILGQRTANQFAAGRPSG